MSIPRERNAWQAHMNEAVTVTLTRGDWLLASSRLETAAEALDEKARAETDGDKACAIDSEAYDLGAIGGAIYNQATGREAEA
jgi:cell division septal protein FtsQ